MPLGYAPRPAPCKLINDDRTTRRSYTITENRYTYPQPTANTDGLRSLVKIQSAQVVKIQPARTYAEKFGRSAPWGFEHVRVHDLKHTFGRRLRAAGVGEETRKVLLGHTNGDITTHYSAVELAELITAVNKIDRSLATPAITLLKVAA